MCTVSLIRTAPVVPFSHPPFSKVVLLLTNSFCSLLFLRVESFFFAFVLDAFWRDTYSHFICAIQQRESYECRRLLTDLIINNNFGGNSTIQPL